MPILSAPAAIIFAVGKRSYSAGGLTAAAAQHRIVHKAHPPPWRRPPPFRWRFFTYCAPACAASRQAAAICSRLREAGFHYHLYATVPGPPPPPPLYRRVRRASCPPAQGRCLLPCPARPRRFLRRPPPQRLLPPWCLPHGEADDGGHLYRLPFNHFAHSGTWQGWTHTAAKRLFMAFFAKSAYLLGGGRLLKQCGIDFERISLLFIFINIHILSSPAPFAPGRCLFCSANLPPSGFALHRRLPPFAVFVVCGGFSVYTVLFIISSNKAAFQALKFEQFTPYA